MLPEIINHRFRAYPTHQAVQTMGSTAFFVVLVCFRNVNHWGLPLINTTEPVASVDIQGATALAAWHFALPWLLLSLSLCAC
jgi:hypothetical protein